jgi:hypothetical protein
MDEPMIGVRLRNRAKQMQEQHIVAKVEVVVRPSGFHIRQMSNLPVPFFAVLTSMPSLRAYPITRCRNLCVSTTNENPLLHCVSARRGSMISPKLVIGTLVGIGFSSYVGNLLTYYAITLLLHVRQ